MITRTRESITMQMNPGRRGRTMSRTLAPVETSLKVPTQARVRVLAAMELASDEGAEHVERDGWMNAVPLDNSARFGLVLSADGRRRRWLADAAAGSYVRALSQWLTDHDVAADERVAMLRMGQAHGRDRIGSWIEEHDGEVSFGWRVAAELPLRDALALAPKSDALARLASWAGGAGVVRAREVMRAAAGDTSMLIETTLTEVQRAFAAMQIAWPRDAVADTFALFPVSAYALAVTFDGAGVAKVGIVAMAPSRPLVLAALDLVAATEAANDVLLASYEAVLGVERPAAIELCVGLDGLDVRVHLAVV